MYNEFRRFFMMLVGERVVKKIIAATLASLFLTITAAWGQDAMEFYQRGLRSSLAYKRIQYFTKALQLNPKLAEAYEKRAVHYYFQDRLDEAIEDYNRVIELKPERVNPYVMRGLAYLKKGHGEGFFAELHRLARRIRKAPPSESREYLERAIADFSRAIELDPQLAKSYSYRAEAYLFRGMIDQAIRDANMAIQLRKDPHSTAVAYATRAEIYRRLGQYDLYETDVRRAAELDPYSPDYPPLHVPLMFGYPLDYGKLEALRWLGLLGIVVLTFVVIFQLRLRVPKKKE